MIRPRGIYALTGAVLAGAACWLLLRSAPDPTPLRNFSVPFVYGHFRVPEDNPLTEEGVRLWQSMQFPPRRLTLTSGCAMNNFLPLSSLLFNLISPRRNLSYLESVETNVRSKLAMAFAIFSGETRP